MTTKQRAFTPPKPRERKPCPRCDKVVSNLKLHQGMDKKCPANAEQRPSGDRM